MVALKCQQNLTPAEDNDVLEIDELWSFVGSKLHRVWLWIALCRRTKQIIAYHLGNRHVWVEVGRQQLSYLHDHVLDDMVRQLGSTITVVDAPFEPEAGASAEHHHGHDHEDPSDEQAKATP